MTPHSRYLPAAALFAALAAAAAATAQEGPMRGIGHGGPFGPHAIDVAAIDADADGSLTRPELLARSAARLGDLDGNGDGALDRAELVTAFPSPARLFDVFGADPAEAMADRVLAMNGGTEAGSVEIAVLSEMQVNMLLARLDADRDAAISVAEAEARMDRHADRGGPEGRHHGPRF